MPFPFEVPFEQVRAELDTYVDEVFGALQSEFLTLPKGAGFLEYPTFEQGYELLKRITNGFREVSADPIIQADKPHRRMVRLPPLTNAKVGLYRSMRADGVS